MPQAITNYVGGRIIDYNTSVALAGTPNIHEVKTDLGRYGTGGYITNDHTTQDLHVYISNDGTSYNCGKYTSASSLPTGAVAYTVLKPKDGLNLSGMQIHTIKVDASGNTTPYRIYVF